MTPEPLLHAEAPKPAASEQLYCSLTGRPITAEEAFWAPPLITVRDLISTIMFTAFHAPGHLGQVLFDEQPDVPYAPEVRDQLAARRSSEQIKLLLGVLLILGLIAAPIVLIALR